VTGGTGFVGSHVAEQLLEQGFTVRCLVRSSRTRLSWLEGLSVDVVKADMTDAKALTRHCEDIDYIFHVAGSTKVLRNSGYRVGNVEVTRNLLLAAAQHPHVKKFCLVSSLAAVGPSYDGQPLTEESPCRPVSLYGASKYEAEQLARRFFDRLPIVILRPPTVYGPRDTDVLEMFQWVNRGFLPTIGNPDKQLSMIHATDLARGIIAATMSEKTAGETYFLSNRPIYPYSEIIRTIAEVLGKQRVRSIRVPTFVLYAVAGGTQLVARLTKKPTILSLDKAREILQPHWICSAEKIKRHIGFEASISLEDGFRSTLEWYRQHGWM
jgi:nucleoside-diphosphate-sugar epimerase